MCERLLTLPDWEQRLVSLKDLIWSDKGLPYVLSIPQTYSADFRKRWLEKVTPEGMKWLDQKRLIDELAFKCSVFADSEMVENLIQLFNCMLSLDCGKPIGTREANLFSYSNTFLIAKARHRYAVLFEQTAKKFGRNDVLKKDTVRKKLAEAKKAEQVKGSLEAKIIKMALRTGFNTKKFKVSLGLFY